MVKSSLLSTTVSFGGSLPYLGDVANDIREETSRSCFNCLKRGEREESGFGILCYSGPLTGRISSGSICYAYELDESFRLKIF